MTIEQTYSSIQDVIDYEIEPALGELAGDYDLRAIADEMFELVVDEDEDGTQISDPYYIERDDVDFWEIVQAHDLTVAE